MKDSHQLIEDWHEKSNEGVMVRELVRNLIYCNHFAKEWIAHLHYRWDRLPGSKCFERLIVHKLTGLSESYGAATTTPTVLLVQKQRPQWNQSQRATLSRCHVIRRSSCDINWRWWRWIKTAFITLMNYYPQIHVTVMKQNLNTWNQYNSICFYDWQWHIF